MMPSKGGKMSDQEIWEELLSSDDIKSVGVYDWDTVLAKIKEYNETKKAPVTVGIVANLFAKEVKYRNEVRQWMERCVERGLLVRWPPHQRGVQPRRVFYLHVDVYEALKRQRKQRKQ